jgi:site-specific recombinase XerD
MTEPEVQAFLTHLAIEGNVAASTQNQALSALLFLYRHVLRQPLSNSIDAVQAGEIQRHHMDDGILQRSLKQAVRSAQIDENVSCHTLRHGFATHLLQNAYDIRTVQELLGHKDVKTTMIYTHVLNKGGRGVRSPLDACA